MASLQNLRQAARLAASGSAELHDVLVELGRSWGWWAEEWEPDAGTRLGTASDMGRDGAGGSLLGSERFHA